MRPGIPLFLGAIFLSSALWGRTNVVPVGAKAAAMSNAFVSEYDVWSVVHNQAGLAKMEEMNIGIYYENRFLVPELSVKAITVTFPVISGNFSFLVSSFGPSFWQETNASVGFSKFLNKKLSAGVQLNYFGMKLPEQNQNAFTVSFETGVIYMISPKTNIGFHVANPVSPAIKTNNTSEKIPWNISLGGNTFFSQSFDLAYEFEKISGQKIMFKTGVSWKAAESFFVRAGINTQSRFSTGIGYKSQFFSADIAFCYHPFLGYTPSISIIYTFL